MGGTAEGVSVKDVSQIPSVIRQISVSKLTVDSTVCFHTLTLISVNPLLERVPDPVSLTGIELVCD